LEPWGTFAFFAVLRPWEVHHMSKQLSELAELDGPAWPDTSPATMECRRCGWEMRLERATPHPFSAVSVHSFKCECGTRDSIVVSVSGRIDDL
jgi:hypothetical protein